MLQNYLFSKGARLLYKVQGRPAVGYFVSYIGCRLMGPRICIALVFGALCKKYRYVAGSTGCYLANTMREECL